MDVRKAIVALALVASACGATGSGAEPSPLPSGVGYAVVATNTDHATTLRVGQKMEVVLRAGAGMQSWAHPKTSDPSVLMPIVDPAATAAIGVTLAAFEAMHPGQADVTSYAGAKCSPGQACPMYLAAYSLRVTVTP